MCPHQPVTERSLCWHGHSAIVIQQANATARSALSSSCSVGAFVLEIFIFCAKKHWARLAALETVRRNKWPVLGARKVLIFA